MSADFSKIGRQNRSKGSRFELRTAELMRESLGFDLVRNLEQCRKDLHGDLVDRVTGKGPFGICIECKNREFKWFNVLSVDCDNGPFEWISKTVTDTRSQDYDKFLLVFRDQSNSKTYGLLYMPILCDFMVPEDQKVWVLQGNVFLSPFDTMMDLIKWNLSKQQTI